MDLQGDRKARRRGKDRKMSLVTEPYRNRRIGISDGMALIGGIACLLVYCKYDVLSFGYYIYRLFNEVYKHFYLLPWNLSPMLRKRMTADGVAVFVYGISLAESLLVVMAPVLLILRLRPPRPPLRALLGQPGTIASLAVVFGSIWVSGWVYGVFAHNAKLCAMLSELAVGGTVAVAWSALGLSRKWKPEPSWMDRTGRAIGTAAIAVGLLVALRKFGL